MIMTGGHAHDFTGTERHIRDFTVTGGIHTGHGNHREIWTGLLSDRRATQDFLSDARPHHSTHNHREHMYSTLTSR